MNFHDFLKRHNACSDITTFVGKKSLREFWTTCPRPNWMLWLLQKANYQDDQMYRLYACSCACNTPVGDGRVTWDLLTDKRSRDAIRVAIRFANGEATRKELAAAWAAAGDAASDACGARDAWEAAWAAVCATYADTDAAARAAGCAAARASTRNAAWAAQADHLRTVVDFKKLERLINQAQRKGTEGGK